jgi:Protein of unknown function (DUF3349)
MALTPLLQSIVDYLREGYPEGVPERDYIPLFALLRRRLTDDEVIQLAEDLADEAPDETQAEKIRVAIRQVIDDTPSESDVQRVQQQLQAAGWVPPERSPG